jgi:phosphatidylserine decarboxylase
MAERSDRERPAAHAAETAQRPEPDVPSRSSRHEPDATSSSRRHQPEAPGSSRRHEPGTPSVVDRLFVALQAPLPHHLLSRLVFRLTRLRARPLVRLGIGMFRRIYRIDLAEAAEPDPRAYPTFNAFFTRALAPGARPVAGGDGAVACPVDGRVSETGTAAGDTLLQAKGKPYRLDELLGGSAERAAPFAGGGFATLYLAPRDYHRIHMPLGGRLRETVYVPGRLWAVNPATARTLPRLFNRNERVVAIFDTAAGRMAMVLVGALFVAGIETVWSGLLTPPHRRRIEVRGHRGPGDPEVELARGEEMGRFNMGSTVIVLFEPGRVRWDPAIVPGATVRMGQRLATVEG